MDSSVQRNNSHSTNLKVSITRSFQKLSNNRLKIAIDWLRLICDHKTYRRDNCTTNIGRFVGYAFLSSNFTLNHKKRTNTKSSERNRSGSTIHNFPRHSATMLRTPSSEQSQCLAKTSQIRGTYWTKVSLSCLLVSPSLMVLSLTITYI